MTPPAAVVLVFLDPTFPQGRLVDASEPALMATDQGATRGDGIFESMLSTAGSVRKIEAHLDRLEGSANALELTVPGRDAWRQAIATALAAYRSSHSADAGAEDQQVVKLIATRGPDGASSPTAWVQVSAVPAKGRHQRESGVDVVLLDRGYRSDVAERAPWLLMGAKTLSYAVNMAAIRHAHHLGADDVIFVSSDGMVLEGPTASVLLAHHETADDGTLVKRLITPQLDSGILPGTSQGALFTAVRAEGWELGYGPLVPQDLLDADAVWLISSIRGLTPVNRIDGQEIGTPALRGQLTSELTSIYSGIQ